MRTFVSRFHLYRSFSSVRTAKLTRESHPNLQRLQFKHLDDHDVSYFRSILQSPGSVLYSKDSENTDLLSYNEDWMKKYRGQTSCVLRPSTTSEVSKLIKYCNEKRIAIVPQGGNTGLVGGGVPVFDEVVLNLQRMDQISSFNPVSGAVVCGAGTILEKLDTFLATKGYLAPIDLGAKGSCHIGGNVATNAGGLRLLRYGNLHGNVLGLKAVLADGTILDNLSTLRKDNSGYDLKQLFIGSEGTLGIITEVSLLACKKPASVNVAVVSLKQYSDVLKVFTKAKAQLSEIISAFECWDGTCNSLVLKHMSSLRSPLEDESAGFYVLIETHGSVYEQDYARVVKLLADLLEDGVIQDGVVAQDASQAASMWSIREGIPEACSKEGAVYKYDVSLPVQNLYDLVNDMKAHLKQKGIYDPNDPEKDVSSVVGYGHIGDGNLHLNITARKYSKEMDGIIESNVYEWIQKYQGSISAEHGLGLMKAPYLKYSKNEEMIKYMRLIKNLFDPNGIMNPYKFLPQAK